MMEIKLNVTFNEILLSRSDGHVIENHDNFFIDKKQNILCAECINKLFFSKLPLYKKYLLLNCINELYSLKNCSDFRYNFSYFLLEHTLFLSNAFSYLEDKVSSSNKNNETTSDDVCNNQDDYIYSVKHELIILATSACKEFLNSCKKELFNIFKDAIYTCILVRLKNTSSNDKNIIFILKILKSLIDNIKTIHASLKEEPALIEEVIKIYIKKYSININKGGEEKKYITTYVENVFNTKDGYSLINDQYSHSNKVIGYTPNDINYKNNNNNNNSNNNNSSNNSSSNTNNNIHSNENDSNNRHNYMHDSNNNGDSNNKEMTLIVQIIFNLWCDNSLWQINKELVKSFFNNIIKNFKYTSKNNEICTYYIHFLYVISQNKNDLIYFFNTILFDINRNSSKKVSTDNNNDKKRIFKNELNMTIHSCDDIKKGVLQQQQQQQQFINSDHMNSHSYKNIDDDSRLLANLFFENEMANDNFDVIDKFEQYAQDQNNILNDNSKNNSINHYSHNKNSKNFRKDILKIDEVDVLSSYIHEYKNNILDEEEDFSILLKRSVIDSDTLKNDKLQSDTIKNAHRLQELKKKKKKKNSNDEYNEQVIDMYQYDEIYRDYNKSIIDDLNYSDSAINYSTDEDKNYMSREEYVDECIKQEHGNKQGYHNKCQNFKSSTPDSSFSILKDFDNNLESGIMVFEKIKKKTFNKFYDNGKVLVTNKNQHNGIEGQELITSEHVNWVTMASPNGYVSDGHSYWIDEHSKEIENEKDDLRLFCNTQDDESEGSDGSNCSDSNCSNPNNKVCNNDSYNSICRLKKKNNFELKLSNKTKDTHLFIFITLCDNLQETLLNNFNKDIQIKCLDIFYQFCNLSEDIVNIIISNTSLVDWILDFLANTKYEGLKYKALNFLVTFFFNNSLFSHTHAYYMLDVMINIILNYVNKTNGVSSNFDNDIYDIDINVNCSFFFFFIKSLNMLIDISKSSIKPFHVFKLMKVISAFIVSSPDATPSNVTEIIMLFENILLIKQNTKTENASHDFVNTTGEISYSSESSTNVSHTILQNEKKSSTFYYNNNNENVNDFSWSLQNKKYNTFDILVGRTKSNYNSSMDSDIKQTKNEKATFNNKDILISNETSSYKYKNNINNYNFDINQSNSTDVVHKSKQHIKLHNAINKVYITNIPALYEILKTALNVIKILNINKQDISVELIFHDTNDFIYELTKAMMKLLFSVVYIINKNEKSSVINLNIIDKKKNIECSNELKIVIFIKLILQFFIELQSFFKNITKEKNTIFKKDVINFIQFLYLTCIFIFESINEQKKMFSAISTNIFFTSFFTPFFHFFSNVLNNFHDISTSLITTMPLHSTTNMDPRQNTTKLMEYSKDGYNSQNKKEQKNCEDRNKNSLDGNNGDNNDNRHNNDSFSNTFFMYNKYMRHALIKQKPFTLFFQYVSNNNYNTNCYRILDLLIYEGDALLETRPNKNDILIELINKNDFYFTKILSFNFNDNEGIIETVIYIFYLCLSYDKNFIEKKLNHSKMHNYVESIFTYNDNNKNINPIFLFMALSYAYYYITQDKILSILKCIKKEMHKINLQSWLNIKKMKNIHFVFDCIFSMKINTTIYNYYLAFIIYITKLELSLYSLQQSDKIDNRLYVSISKNI
ncbi:conserved protein, unknown function, partial [Hepatocystis sp. ex Piliocolobus tephrosceles]